MKTREEREQRRADKQAAKAEQAFWASPQGQARRASLRGDRLHQVQIELADQAHNVVPMATAFASRSDTPQATINDHLNAVASEGWELVTATVAFIQTGSESRDKFMMSGQNEAISGQFVGVYLFRRTYR